MSKLSVFLHSSQGNSLFANLLSVIANLVESNNSKYAPIVEVASQVATAELQSLAAGNSPTPHAVDQTAPAPTVVSTDTPTATVTTSTEVKAS